MLRDRGTSYTLDLSAMNIAVATGSTFDRLVIFLTSPRRGLLDDGDTSELKAPKRLGVAFTRARHSVALVVPS